ncbi:MAG: hypothetical protein OWS03_10335 [Alicyclobacillaceae bacterium]|nr:hypothetical protein [Alicyclobacillaceae bacterium]
MRWSIALLILAASLSGLGVFPLTISSFREKHWSKDGVGPSTLLVLASAAAATVGYVAATHMREATKFPHQSFFSIAMFSTLTLWPCLDTVLSQWHRPKHSSETISKLLLLVDPVEDPFAMSLAAILRYLTLGTVTALCSMPLWPDLCALALWSVLGGAVLRTILPHHRAAKLTDTDSACPEKCAAKQKGEKQSADESPHSMF